MSPVFLFACGFRFRWHFLPLTKYHLGNHQGRECKLDVSALWFLKVFDFFSMLSWPSHWTSLKLYLHILLSVQFSSVQLLSPIWLFVTPWFAAHQSSLSITNPGVYPNPCPSSWWCHPAISSFVVPFSSCPQSLPASGSFPMSQLFAWGGQSTGVSASASVLPVNTQDWSPLGWTGWISLQSKGLSKSLLQHHSSKASIVRHSAFFTVLASTKYMK